MLLEAGANADQADFDGWTPLRAAAWGGHTEVKEIFVAILFFWCGCIRVVK